MTQVVQTYHWFEDLLYTDSQGHDQRLGVIDFHEVQTNTPKDCLTLAYPWITNFSLTHHNVNILVNQGARLRWKIENEGFNVQKNSELQLQHAYSHDPVAQKVFYSLLQLACILFQLIQHGSLLRQTFPDGLRTAKNLVLRLLEAWRNLSMEPETFLALGEERFQIRLDSS